jgi:phosphocarrier protein HPr
MFERHATVASKVGLHARPAALLAKAAADVPVDVTIALDGTDPNEALNASSVLGLMSLGAEYGAIVVLRAEGDGAEQALNSLVAVIETDHDSD